MSHIREVPYVEPANLLTHWPRPIVFLGGAGRYAILAIAPKRVAWETMAELRFAPARMYSELPFHFGYIGCMPYDDGAEAHLYEVNAALIFDQEARRAWCSGEPPECAHEPLAAARPYALVEHRSPSDYLGIAERAIEEIKSGRYYQINLLRYFDVVDAEFLGLAAKALARGGSYSALFEDGAFGLVSFSPEEFVAIDGRKAHTFPIKGTLPRRAGHDDRAELMGSTKNRAELTMIVDLMRNDLARLSTVGSVRVESIADVITLPYVYHLQAHVSSLLREGVSFAELREALMPAGSITGAPKIEVIKAIREHEMRRRGHFMGNVFYWDRQTGRFDSSVLIRTAVKSLMGWEYAAGSGITAGSTPTAELEEIAAKCNVLTL